MEEFPSNSISSTTPKVRRPIPSEDAPEIPSPAGGEKVIKKIVTSGAIKKKRTIGSRLKSFMSSRDGQTLYDFLQSDVLGRVEEIIAIVHSVERLTRGDVGGARSAYRGPRTSGPIRYERYGTPSREPRNNISRHARASHDFEEIELQSYAEANAVLRQMDEFVTRFGQVAVADMYEMVELEADFVDERWGWRDLSGADIRRTRNGRYVLVLPRTEPITPNG